jgi:enediyne biosynthesis protein E4
MRSRWRKIVLTILVATMVWTLWKGYRAWSLRRELARAQSEIAARQIREARVRLAALVAAHPGAMGGRADYLLAMCEALCGNEAAALASFARVPKEFEYAPFAAYLEARANLECGRLRSAEERLEASLRRGVQDAEQLVGLLVRVYELQARFADVQRLLRSRLERSSQPLPILRDLANINLGRHPYQGLRAALEQAARREPNDDRVWLGKARLAIAAGQWNEAAGWLERCQSARGDPAVWSARLEWAQGAGRPDEALRAFHQLKDGGLEPREQLAFRAWLFARREHIWAEREALEQWLSVDPAAVPALARLAELAERSGESDLAARLKKRKAEVNEAQARYRVLLWGMDPLARPDKRMELARLAESAGFSREARALYSLIPDNDNGHGEAQAAIGRIDRVAADRLAQSTLAGPPEMNSLASIETDVVRIGAAPRIIPMFCDEADSAGLRFTYDSGKSILHQLPEQSGGGVALLDYDGDGWLDVYCVQGGPFPPQADQSAPCDRLFHNRGNGSFEDVTRSSGIAALSRGYGHGVTVGDYDGDGDPDLFVTRWRRYALYRNNGNGTFSDVTDVAGLGGVRGWPTSAAFADLDGDGDLDLYVCHYVAWDERNPRLCRNNSSGAYIICNPRESEAESDHLFRNDDGRFVDVTAVSGVVDRDGRGLGVLAADLDGDGKVDLFVANDLSANYLFHNKGGMRFEEMGQLAGVSANASGNYQAGMGIAAGDLDGDGLMDLVVTNFLGESTTFYRGLGGGLFADHTAAIGLAAATRNLLGFGVAFLDANDDGWLDIVSANGHVNDLRPNYPFAMPAQLLLGDGDGRLIDVSNRAGAPWLVHRIGRGLAVGDLDNDGRQDVLILSHNSPLAYLHNLTQGGGGSLTLRLDGRAPNRDAVGARVVVVAGGRRLTAWRYGGGSFQSASDSRLHFSLGSTSRVESVEVAWPSGHVDHYRSLHAGLGYLLREGEGREEPLRGFSRD